jgi:tetratricopeptide (TPR) repeat protein
MGNIFAIYYKDIDTVLTCYKQLARANPDDNIGLNSIGAILAQAGKNKEIIEYFLQAKNLDPEYGSDVHGGCFAVFSEDGKGRSEGCSARCCNERHIRYTTGQIRLYFGHNTRKEIQWVPIFLLITM